MNCVPSGSGSKNWLAPEDADATTRRHLALNQAALKLRLVTAQRGVEVIALRWQDIDLDGGGWTIPAEHAKNKMPHRVPLNGHGDQDSQRRAAGYACR
jgi:integrase